MELQIKWMKRKLKEKKKGKKKKRTHVKRFPRSGVNCYIPDEYIEIFLKAYHDTYTQN